MWTWSAQYKISRVNKDIKYRHICQNLLGFSVLVSVTCLLLASMLSLLFITCSSHQQSFYFFHRYREPGKQWNPKYNTSLNIFLITSNTHTHTHTLLHYKKTSSTVTQIKCSALPCNQTNPTQKHTAGKLSFESHILSSDTSSKPWTSMSSTSKQDLVSAYITISPVGCKVLSGHGLGENCSGEKKTQIATNTLHDWCIHSYLIWTKTMPLMTLSVSSTLCRDGVWICERKHHYFIICSHHSPR